MDKRVTLARADLADAALQGIVPADRYERTTAWRCAVPAASIRRAPGAEAEQLDQLLFGETFRVLESAGGWGWGQADRDGYVGHVRLDDLAQGVLAATHRVSAVRAHAFSAPDLAAPSVGLFTLNALVVVEAEEGLFCKGEGTGWFARAVLAPIGEPEDDPAGVAERFLGAAYVWGGRSGLELDCSALVQHALHACGKACPRDSDMQALLGRPAPADGLQRGDLVLWKGHLGMMLDAERLLHANATFMQVSIEPLATAVARIGEPTAYRRV